MDITAKQFVRNKYFCPISQFHMWGQRHCKSSCFGTRKEAPMDRLSHRPGNGFLPLLVLFLVIIPAGRSFAIPAFSRLYGTSCSTCHIDFPKLNDFGKAFKDAGFKFPKDDETMLKIPPVMLGAPANAELWPKAIWPGTIPGIPPIGLRYNNYFQYTSTNRTNVSQLVPPGTVTPFIPTTDFETGFFSIFSAGNFGSDIAFWVDDDISVSGANANGTLGEAYLKFVDIGRLMKLPPYALTMRVGQIELDIPFTQSKSIWISPYDIYSQANVGIVNPAFGQQFVNNAFTFAGSGKGIELSGGHSTGGYHYSVAFIDQNTSGTPQGTNNGYVPTATGSNFGGVGVASDANFKDIYTNFQYRFNLEHDKESRNAIQAAGPTGPRDHTYLNFGTYWLYGRSVQRLPGATLEGLPTVVTALEPFYRVGGNMTFNYRCCLQFNALWMYGHDNNLLPVDANGMLVPLPVSGTTLPVGFNSGRSATFSGGFADVEWLAYPWMMVLMRYDGVNSTSDYINGLTAGGFQGSPFNGAAHATRDRITPGVQFLIHANIKASFEYQFRPSQSVAFVTNPATGLPVAINPFHTNTAVAGFEFVY